MNKTLKKVLITLALVVVVVLVIVLIEVLLPKKHTSGTIPVSPSASSALSPSPSASASPSIVPSASPTPSASPSATPSDAGTVTTEQTAEGTKYNVTVPGAAVSYSITADSAVFTNARDGGSELFKLVKNKDAYVKISFLPGVKAASTAPGFLDAYIKYTNFDQSGKNYIDGTKIVGETVMADDGKTQVTAWLVDTEGGVLAVAMSLSLSEQKAVQPQLDKLLSTLTVKP